jgi:hypothetical protein
VYVKNTDIVWAKFSGVLCTTQARPRFPRKCMLRTQTLFELNLVGFYAPHKLGQVFPASVCKITKSLGLNLVGFYESHNLTRPRFPLKWQKQSKYGRKILIMWLLLWFLNIILKFQGSFRCGLRFGNLIRIAPASHFQGPTGRGLVCCGQHHWLVYL